MQTSTHKSTFVQAIKEVLGQSGRSPSSLYDFGFRSNLQGVRGLYTGLSASIFRQMTYSITRLGAYDALKARLSQDGTFPFVDLADIRNEETIDWRDGALCKWSGSFRRISGKSSRYVVLSVPQEGRLNRRYHSGSNGSGPDESGRETARLP
jgi:hypothetical protein